MKNTIITSVSALVFLAIGLLIGKSNKQIEIQTVVKTNIVEKPVDKIVEKIVEKPVVEYVDKYITNVIEKVVEAEIPENYKNALDIHKRLLNANYIKSGDLPSGITDLHIETLLNNKYHDIINPKQITESLEFEARKMGLKINKESDNILFFELNIMKLDDGSQYVYTANLSISRMVYLFTTPNKPYKILPEVWSKRSFGIVGKNKFNQTTFNEEASEKMLSFCNGLLKTREK